MLLGWYLRSRTVFVRSFRLCVRQNTHQKMNALKSSTLDTLRLDRTALDSWGLPRSFAQ